MTICCEVNGMACPNCDQSSITAGAQLQAAAGWFQKTRFCTVNLLSQVWSCPSDMG